MWPHRTAQKVSKPNLTLNNKKINDNKFAEKYVVMNKIDMREGGGPKIRPELKSQVLTILE